MVLYKKQVFVTVIVLLLSISYIVSAIAETSFYPNTASTNGVVASNVLDAPITVAQSSACESYFKDSHIVTDCRLGEVPVPVALWLFILALFFFVILSNKKRV